VEGVAPGGLLERKRLLIFARTGLVRSPVTTTLMQVASRLLLVWGVVDQFPSVANSPAYVTMLTAWGVTEIVRYYFYMLALRGAVPGFMNWLRYAGSHYRFREMFFWGDY
jgi:very-long-chain (3R)-3-hydroxyacyl-CoA dehydratase